MAFGLSNSTIPSLLRTAIAMVALVSFSSGALIPQQVKAQDPHPGRAILPMTTVTDSPEVLAVTREDLGFPSAGKRTPVRTITVVATAYNSLAAQTDSTPCITANGHDLCKQYEETGVGNTIASNFLPFGTRVRFPDMFGDKVFVVRDRMNARYGAGRVDIWMAEYGEARQFGGRRIIMEIYN